MSKIEKPQKKNTPKKPVGEISFQQFRSGPLPTPQEFEYYEKVLPGSAERILRMAEVQPLISRLQHG